MGLVFGCIGKILYDVDFLYCYGVGIELVLIWFGDGIVVDFGKDFGVR